MGDPCGQKEQHNATAHGVAGRGAVWGQQQLQIPESWLFCPCSPRKRAYSKEAVYSDKLQHYSTGRGEQEKGEKQAGEMLPNLYPSCAPLLQVGSKGDHGVVGAPMADGQDHRVGVEMSTCVCQGVGEGRLQWCSTVGGKRNVPGGILGNDDRFGSMSGAGGM